jgi:hypothetical protein
MKSSMKNTFLSSHRYVLAVGGLSLGLALLLCTSASAEELLKNGNFEAPFPVSDPTAGWALVYVDGGPGDFAIAGPSTEANRGVPPTTTAFGAHIRPNNWNYAHAYFKQVVTNLTEGASYTLNIQKMRAGFKWADEGPPAILKVYASLVSGSSSNGVEGRFSNSGPYSLVITCSATRQIEVQLHTWKRWMCCEVADDMKHAKCSGWFDDFSLTPTP